MGPWQRRSSLTRRTPSASEAKGRRPGFKAKSPEEQAAKDRQRAAEQAARERAAFERTPVGLAAKAYARGDHLFQYSHDVESQDAVIVAMIGSTTNRKSTDPSDILNAVCKQGWELVNGSFVFREQGQQSRDKFMSSGQNVATKGTTVGYYLFRRCPDNLAINGEVQQLG